MGRATTTTRAGIATLELCMGLPIVLACIVALIWFGYSLIGQVNVNVEARHATWSERFSPWNQQPFDFSASQTINESATATVDVVPLLADMPGPEAEQFVAQGNWDHRSVEWTAAPNWSTYADLIVAARLGGLDVAYDAAQLDFQQIADLARTALADALADLAQQLINPHGEFLNLGQPAELRSDLEADLAIEKLKGDIQETEREIEQLADELRNLDENDTARRWLMESQLDRLQIRLELLEQRLRLSQR